MAKIEKEKRTFVDHFEWYETFESMAEEDVDEIIRIVGTMMYFGAFRYCKFGEMPSFPKGSAEWGLFRMMKVTLDADREKWIAKRDSGRDAVAFRWAKEKGAIPQDWTLEQFLQSEKNKDAAAQEEEADDFFD